MNLIRPRLLETAGADGAAAAGAAAVTPPPAAAPAAAPAPALAAGGGEQAKPLAERIPEKLRVMKDGTFDLEGSFAKVEEARSSLEKRMGGEHIRPKASTDYTFKVPDTMPDWKPDADPTFTGFRDRAHSVGLSQSQFDFVMGEYLTVAPQLANAGAALSAEDTTSQLREMWKAPGEFDANMAGAYKGLMHYAGSKEAGEAMLAKYGNDADLIQFLARVSKDMGEAPAVNSGDGVGEGQSIESVMASPAYLDIKHPEHKATAERVRQHYLRKHGTAAAN